MSTQFGVDLVFNAKNVNSVTGATNAVRKLNGEADKTQASMNRLTGKFSRTGQEVRRAANGMEYFIDKMGRARKVNGQFVNTTEAAAAGIRNTGRAAKAATPAVLGLGRALKTALAPLFALATVAKAFQAFSEADTAAAKVRTLGVDVENLQRRLLAVSVETGNAASQTELLAAAYDVASAGFGDVAGNADVLKAALLGARGGFSDINTVANATTSVLNTYGLSAENAGRLVDGFIQTQNDGKIVLDEYARQIGRLAPISSAAGVGIEDLNAAISTITAQGVPVEATFTGLRQGLVSVLKPTAEAEELAGALGIQFDAAGLKAKGFAGFMDEVYQKTKGNPELLNKLFGSVEAVAAILPLTNDGLEKFNQNLDNQKEKSGQAAAAAQLMGATVSGQLTKMINGIGNLARALDVVLGPALRAIFNQINQIISSTTKMLSLIADLNIGQSTRQVGQANFSTFFGATDQAIDNLVGATKELDLTFVKTEQDAKKVEATLNRISNAMANARERGLSPGGLDKAGSLSLVVGDKRKELAALRAAGFGGENSNSPVEVRDAAAEERNKQIQAILKSLDDSSKKTTKTTTKESRPGRYIQGGIGPRGVNQYGDHFDIKRSDGGFYNRSALDQYVRVNGRPLSSGVTVPGGEYGAPRNYGPHAGWDYAFGKGAALQLTGGAKWVGSQKTGYGDQASFQLPNGEIYKIIHGIFEPGNGDNAPAAVSALAGYAQDIKENTEAARKNIADFVAETQRGTESFKQQLADQEKLNNLLSGGMDPAAAQQRVDNEREILNIQIQGVQAIEELKRLNEQNLLTTEEMAKAEGSIRDATAEKVTYAQRYQAALKKTQAIQEASKPGKIESKIQQYREELADTEGMIVSLAGTIESAIGGAMSNAITGLIDGTQTAQEAFSQMFKQIGSAFIQMATQMIAKALVMKALGIISGGAGGGGVLGSFGGGTSIFGNSISDFGGGTALFSFAGGGYTGDGARTGGLDGEGGYLAMVHPKEQVVDLTNPFADARSAMERGSQNRSSVAYEENADALSVSTSVMRERLMEREREMILAGSGGNVTVETQVINNTEYATVEQLQVASEASAKKARAQVFSDMKNRPATRRQMGMR